jgi:hypothetical protein
MSDPTQDPLHKVNAMQRKIRNMRKRLREAWSEELPNGSFVIYRDQKGNQWSGTVTGATVDDDALVLVDGEAKPRRVATWSIIEVRRP